MVMEEDTSSLVNGPDQLVTCNNLITWDPKGSVKIRMERTGKGAMEPISIPGLLMKTARENPHIPALKIREPKTGVEKTWTWTDYHQDVRTVAKAFISLGFARFDSVCILGFNAPEWVISDVAAIFAGGFASGIYPTNGPEACKYILEQSNCSILVVEDGRQLDKVWALRDQLPHLKKVVQYSGVPTHPGVLSWADLLSRGKEQEEEILMARLRRIAINQCSTLVFTSGTTGNPKGVMLSHDNMTWNSINATSLYKMEHANTRVLSYLPLSHVAAQMVDIVAMMAVAGTTYFADKNVLKSSLLDNLQWCKPTVFFAVPRVWEKIMEKMMEKAKDVKGLKKTVSRKAKEIGLKYHTKGTNATEFKLFQKIYYSKVKALLGLDQCMAFMSGAAPIDRKTQNYFLSLDIMILELYGMSETTGGHTFNTVSKFKMSSVGAPLAECYKSKLMRPTNDEVTEEKELLMWGRHIMMGYAGRQDATRKDMTEDGWLRSGDLVSIDNEGFHAIVGREKDLIITAGGENIAPQPIHDLVKEQLPVISQVLLLGDKQKFVSCFLTLAVEVDPETMEPTGKLSSAARDWVQAQGSNATTVQEVLEGPDVSVMRGIQAGIDKANKEAVSNAQRIQKWMVIPRDFSLPGGELGPTMKVKRQAVTKKYEGCIERIYNIA
jgi:long-chain-fatty-acid--CoA ligase ACSBG